MARIRGRDTSPEMALRSALWRLGLRYRVHCRIGRTRPDIAFLGPKVVIFVDGCFWHGCPIHAVIPKTNREFWQNKISRNKVRDAENNEFLQKEGWQVLRFWEHEIESHADLCAKRVLDLIRARTQGSLMTCSKKDFLKVRLASDALYKGYKIKKIND